MEQHILDLIGRHGTPVLFAAQMFGIFGLPIPDELLLTIAGGLVKTGRLHPVSTLVSTVGGCLTGVTLSYTLGRTVGVAALRRVIHVPPEALTKGQRWFRHFGGWLLTFGYFIPGVRHVTAIAAGSAPLSFARFAAFAYPGGLLWCLVFLGAGYLAGDRWRAVAGGLPRHVAAAAVVLLATAGLAWVVWRYRASGSESRT